MRQGFESYKCKNTKLTQNYGGLEIGAISESDGERYPINFLEFSRDKDKYHPTQKPVDLLKYLIKTYTKESETVLDFTMGSGSTGVASIQLNRNFIGIELDKKYFAISQNRINECIKVKERVKILKQQKPKEAKKQPKRWSF